MLLALSYLPTEPKAKTAPTTRISNDTEPRTTPPMGLSVPVEAALDEAVLLVESLIAQVREGRGAGVAK